MQGLAKELAHEGACEKAIYPEAVFVQDRCAFPAGMIQQGVSNLPQKFTCALPYYDKSRLELIGMSCYSS